MKNKKYVLPLIISVFIMVLLLLIVLKAISDHYSYDDIPREYITGEIISISKEDESIELLLDHGEPTSVTMTVNGKVKIYEISGENVKTVDFTKLKVGQTIQCDIRLSVTLEKINSFHDCRQIFILPDEEIKQHSKEAT